MTKPTTDLDLDLFLAAARDAGPVLSDDLRAHILADADAALAPAPQKRAGLSRFLRSWLPPSLAGGVTAAFGGFWIGAATSLPVAALDVPVWLDQTMIYFDMVAMPLLGVTDLSLAGF
ncbi:MAG: hypothetical protein ACK4HW_00880 [Roseinatronobacter sp.]